MYRDKVAIRSHNNIQINCNIIIENAGLNVREEMKENT